VGDAEIYHNSQKIKTRLIDEMFTSVMGNVKLFVMNQVNENYRQNLYMSVGVMKD
jgi:hypothetical protein